MTSSISLTGINKVSRKIFAKNRDFEVFRKSSEILGPTTVVEAFTFARNLRRCEVSARAGIEIKIS